MFRRLTYWPGDIVAVESSGLLALMGWLIFKPATRFFHHLTIRARLEEELDYEIIEMLGSVVGALVSLIPFLGKWLTPPGCTIGRLSWYDGCHYAVLRLNDAETLNLGKRAAKYASKFGRLCYDFRLYLHLAGAVFRCWYRQLRDEWKLRRIDPSEIDLGENGAFVCTELPVAIWCLVGKDVLAPGDARIPAAYQKAIMERRLLLIDEHWPEKG